MGQLINQSPILGRVYPSPTLPVAWDRGAVSASIIIILIFGLENGLQMSYRPDNMMNLKQNRSSNLILTSKKAQILQNLSKIAKNGCPNPKNPKKKIEKKISASKNRKLQIVRNTFSRSFAAIGAKFEGRTDVRNPPRRDSRSVNN